MLNRAQVLTVYEAMSSAMDNTLVEYEMPMGGQEAKLQVFDEALIKLIEEHFQEIE